MPTKSKHKIIGLYEHPTKGVIEIIRIIETYPKTDTVNVMAIGNVRYSKIPIAEIITI